MSTVDVARTGRAPYRRILCAPAVITAGPQVIVMGAFRVGQSCSGIDVRYDRRSAATRRSSPLRIDLPGGFQGCKVAPAVGLVGLGCIRSLKERVISVRTHACRRGRACSGSSMAEAVDRMILRYS
jgi:hypothetical protein